MRDILDIPMKQVKQDTQAGDRSANPEKPKIKRVEYNIDGLEHNFDQEQKYRDFGDQPAVRVWFENGAKLKVRMSDGDIPIEETFKADDPYSVWAGGHELNGFDYSHCENDKEKVVFAVQANIDQYLRDSRQTEGDFSDWETVQEVVF